MTLQITIENLEKTYLDSMNVISHSKNTVKTCQSSIRRFRSFLNEISLNGELDLLENIHEEKIDIYRLLKDFVIFMDKSGLKPASIKCILSIIKGYLRHCGIKISSDDLKLLVKLPKDIKRREIPIEKDVIIRLLRNAKPKLQLGILIAVSTGMRVGEIAQLKISDIDFNSNPTKVYIRAETTKTRQSRECFLTTEATNALKDYLKRYHGWFDGIQDTSIFDKQIFSTIYRNRGPFIADSAIKALQVELKDLVRSIPDLNIKDENGRQVYHFHAFRKFFRTTVGNVCGRDFAEAIIGHGFYLDTYYQLSEEKKKEMFFQVEPFLTISDFQKVSDDYQSLKERYSKLESKFDELIEGINSHLISMPGINQTQREGQKLTQTNKYQKFLTPGL